MPAECAPSYDDLAGEVYRLVTLQRRVFARMKRARPGSVAGVTLARAHTELDGRISAAHRAARAHPDAPPQG